jgi:hypothetical protein
MKVFLILFELFGGKVKIEDLEVSYQSARWEQLRWVCSK